MANLNGWHLVILLAVLLLLFGAAKLPALAKSVGQSARVFKGEMSAMRAEPRGDVRGDESSAGVTNLGNDGPTTPASIRESVPSQP